MLYNSQSHLNEKTFQIMFKREFKSVSRQKELSVLNKCLCAYGSFLLKNRS